MIELKILDIFIPIDLPYNKQDLILTATAHTQDFSLPVHNSQSIRLPPDLPQYPLSLFHNSCKISSTSQTFEFLKTSSPYSELDDWVKFEVFPDTRGSTCKYIRIRISGKYLVRERKLSMIASIKDLDQVSEKSAHCEESSRSHHSVNIQSYQREFNCEYIKNVSNIEFCFKSIDCMIKRISCYDALDFYTPSYETGKIAKVSCRVEPENQVFYLANEREIEFLDLALDLKVKFAGVQVEEIGLIKKLSNGLEDKQELMNEARRTVKNDFIENIENVENLINEILEQNLAIEGFLESVDGKNKELAEEKERLLREVSEVEGAVKRNRDQKIKNKEKYQKPSIEQEEIAELRSKLKKSIGDLKSSNSKFEKDTLILNQEISNLISQSSIQEKSFHNLQTQNHSLTRQLSLLQVDSPDSPVSPNSPKSPQTPHSNPNTCQSPNPRDHLLKTKAHLNQSSSHLIKQISQVSKTLKSSGFSIQKSIDSLLTITKPPNSNSKPIPSISKALTSPSSLLSSLILLQSHSDSLYSQRLSLLNSSHSLQKFSLINSKLLSIQDLQSTLYTKIACELKPVWKPSIEKFDRIDLALSEFLNMNRTLANYEIEKKAFGVYTVSGKVVHLTEHNGNLVVKSGSGLVPIKSFFQSLGKRVLG